MNTPETLGARLKFARKRAFTQKALSEAVGIAQNTISHYENDLRKPTAPVLQKLCETIGVSPNWLLTGEGEMRTYGAPGTQIPSHEEVGCRRCRELEAELKQERHERRELSAENRQLHRDKEKLFNEIVELKTQVVTLEERLKTLIGGGMEAGKAPDARTA